MILDRIFFWRARRHKALALLNEVTALRETSSDLATQSSRAATALMEAVSEQRREAEARYASLDERVTAAGASFANLAASLNHALTAFKSELLAELEKGNSARLAPLTQSLTELGRVAAESRLGVEKVSVELPNSMTHLGTSVHSRLNSFENDYLVQIRTDLQHVAGLAREAAHAVGVAPEAKLLLEKLLFELPNMLIHIESSLQSRLNRVENEAFPAVWRAIHEVMAVELRALAARADRSAWAARTAEHYLPAKPELFRDYLARAEKEFGTVYGYWHERLLTIERAFELTKVGNAAHAGDLYSRLFRSFCEIHAAGRILDVGCGVFGCPYYLRSYPRELISGIEPLAMREPCDFELVRGFSEYLPWPDEAFSTVVSATSLDHCLSLDRSLSEMTRVLTRGGKILLWIGSNPGSPKYEPAPPGFQPADQFHVFHFDVVWFEPMLEVQFDIIDRLEFQRPGYSHVFYALQPLARATG
jgi:SAM-dependent methyltransferase